MIFLSMCVRSGLRAKHRKTRQLSATIDHEHVISLKNKILRFYVFNTYQGNLLVEPVQETNASSDILFPSIKSQDYEQLQVEIVGGGAH